MTESKGYKHTSGREGPEEVRCHDSCQNLGNLHILFRFFVTPHV
jgi:hypothetical protein